MIVRACAHVFLWRRRRRRWRRAAAAFVAFRLPNCSRRVLLRRTAQTQHMATRGIKLVVIGDGAVGKVRKQRRPNTGALRSQFFFLLIR